MTPDEINQAVAKRLGWHGIYTSPFEREYLGTEVTNKTVLQIGEFEGRVRPIPNYCGDIRAAWEIIDYCENELLLYQIDLSWSRVSDSWYCTMGTRNQLNEGVAADTVPMSIALAFLEMK